VQLSGEDLLKLNVLLHNDIHAVRIHESSMTLYALSASGDEAKVELNPNCNPDRYLKQVRELLSGHVLGSPGGYPVFLKRWTRMGQAKDESLADLLLLGEPEAVVAVANAPGLTNELARRAWWADPISENARRMLANPNVVAGDMGPVLADFLVEHLAFESEPMVQIDTVRLVLQPGLVNEAVKNKLWTSGARKNALRVGFLQASPDTLPESQPQRPDFAEIEKSLAPIAESNRLAMLIMHTLDSGGQSFLNAVAGILRKPANQDVVVALTNTIGTYFAAARQADDFPRDINDLIEQSETAWTDANGNKEIAELKQHAPHLAPVITAVFVLSRISEEIVTPIFAKTTAEGTLMRRKLEPVTAPLFEQIAKLR
jgi:hypothetical protein